MQFSSLNIIQPILQSLKNEGYQNPTPVQQQAIPAILDGKDVLACAQTGTGKTAAFAIPILQLITASKKNRPNNKAIRCLILTPTRELAIQIQESIVTYGKGLQIRNTAVFGGVNQYSQVQTIQRGVDILVATPGRLLDLMQQGLVAINQIEMFVLDEADRMLDMGFVHDVKKIIQRIPVKRQTLFFSATMPQEIQSLSSTILTNPIKITVNPVSSTADTIQQEVFMVARDSKRPLLRKILNNSSIDNILVFTKTKHGANKVVKELIQSGIEAEAIHGNKSQNARQQALSNFKNKMTRVLVATDIAARGIDVDDLKYVLNYDLPDVAETYVHRIGRTGRAGNDGTSYSFCDQNDYLLLKDIEKLIGKKININTNHDYHVDVTTLPIIPKQSNNRGGFGQSNRPKQAKSDKPRQGADKPKQGDRPKSKFGFKPKNKFASNGTAKAQKSN